MSDVYKTLFSPFEIAGQTIRNRIAMAPLTRQMAELDGTPTDEMAAYYARRARESLTGVRRPELEALTHLVVDRTS